MPQAGYELATPATKRPKTYALDLAATGIGTFGNTAIIYLHETDKIHGLRPPNGRLDI
jgi:hypothetical protein